jgi:transcriptional regulator with XRE-family HTH domain
VERVASEFLRAVRGKRSQLAFARRLGVRANPMTDWERGVRFPAALEALRAASRTNIDVAAAFRRFAPEVPLELSVGLAYKPNPVETPFGRADYSLTYLTGGWYWFYVNNDY